MYHKFVHFSYAKININVLFLFLETFSSPGVRVHF